MGLRELVPAWTAVIKYRRLSQDGVEGRGETPEGGAYVYLWLTHVDVWQKPTQYCKAIIIQLKKIDLNKIKEIMNRNHICEELSVMKNK